MCSSTTCPSTDEARLQVGTRPPQRAQPTPPSPSATARATRCQRSGSGASSPSASQAENPKDP
eukprot:5769174-Lingulodinium_polyedra.AAC.1